MAETNELNIPQPTFDENDVEDTAVELTDITADAIQAEILKTDETGYCPCTIVALIEKLHDVDEDVNFEEIADDQREIIDSADVMYCRVDMYSFDGDLVNLRLIFDTPDDGYMKDLTELLNEYKQVCEDYIDQKTKDLPMLSLTFIPTKFDGKAGATFSFPVSYFRTIDDEKNTETTLHLLFNEENIAYEEFDLDEDTVADIQADVLREFESKDELNENYSTNMFE